MTCLKGALPSATSSCHSRRRRSRLPATVGPRSPPGVRGPTGCKYPPARSKGVRDMTKQEPLIEMAVLARTVGDVNALEEALYRRLNDPRVRYLGDKEANWAEISSPADPTALVFERVT